jgi:hypothetical protein
MYEDANGIPINPARDTYGNAVPHNMASLKRLFEVQWGIYTNADRNPNPKDALNYIKASNCFSNWSEAIYILRPGVTPFDVPYNIARRLHLAVRRKHGSHYGLVWAMPTLAMM